MSTVPCAGRFRSRSCARKWRWIEAWGVEGSIFFFFFSPTDRVTHRRFARLHLRRAHTIQGRTRRRCNAPSNVRPGERVTVRGERGAQVVEERDREEEARKRKGMRMMEGGSERSGSYYRRFYGNSPVERGDRRRWPMVVARDA